MVEDNGRHRYPVIVDPTRPVNMAPRVVPHGQCVVLADNRQMTAGDQRHFGDSREFGPIPLADIMGRVAYVYWPALSWSRFGCYAQ
ncbi:hypothetical protein Dvar_49750 [Desulfosarcina variabilis str. Montpellier]|uniref:S26 family signal peptidase n=1 Tax=Desulfosarcina variabilis TaxID=2300 RepID=UPI003AFABE41